MAFIKTGARTYKFWDENPEETKRRINTPEDYAEITLKKWYINPENGVPFNNQLTIGFCRDDNPRDGVALPPDNNFIASLNTAVDDLTKDHCPGARPMSPVERDAYIRAGLDTWRDMPLEDPAPSALN